MPASTAIAYRARRCIPLAGEGLAVGEALSRPLMVIDNALLVCAGGRIVSVGPYAAARVPAGVPVRDLGDVTLIPAAINAHTHIQLSHLAGRTRWGQGFVPWLRSLIPLLAEPLQPERMGRALREMALAGTAHAADFTGAGAAQVAEAARLADVGCTLLVEWFGFAPPPPHAVWPPLSQGAVDAVPAALREYMAPAGHALYSTHMETLQRTHAWCRAHGRPFSLHLAESPEETEALRAGRGALVELYSERVLPQNWTAPGLPPVRLAEKWGLLGTETLAVHCVQCSADDIALLVSSGTRVCLCPRSNDILGVGRAPVELLARAGVALCLGSDGLTSCPDMDVWQDAAVLLRRGALPATALLRMATSNAAAILGLPLLGALEPGRLARWAAVPEALACALCGQTGGTRLA